MGGGGGGQGQHEGGIFVEQQRWLKCFCAVFQFLFDLFSFLSSVSVIFLELFLGFFLHAPLNLMNALLMIQQFIQQQQFSSSSITGTPTVIKDEMSVTVAAKTKLWLSLIDLSRCGQDRENMQFAHRNLSNQSNPGAKQVTRSNWHPSPRATATPAP